MPESIQHKLDRVRPPRVQITYDVEIGGAIQKRELPLVVGVMADLSGNPEAPLPKLKERKFVEIDRDNFNEILKACAPRLTLRVPNKLTKEGGWLNAELKFKNIDDFMPVTVADDGSLGGVLPQVEVLKKLYEARRRLSDLLSKLDGNDALDSALQQAVKNTEELKQIQSSIGGAQNGNA